MRNKRLSLCVVLENNHYHHQASQVNQTFQLSQKCSSTQGTEMKLTSSVELMFYTEVIFIVWLALFGC